MFFKMNSFGAKRIYSMGVLALLLLGCSEKEPILKGERLDLYGNSRASLEKGNVSQSLRPIVLSSARINSTWTHRNGSEKHIIFHPELNVNPVLKWSRNIGVGNTKRLRLSADPIVASGRVFVMDANGQVSAFTTGGTKIWTRDASGLVDRKEQISGGGLAYGDGVLVVATGYGDVLAITPETGSVKWRHKLNASVSSAPLVSMGKVVVIVGNNNVVSLHLTNGRIAWKKETEQMFSGVLGTGSAAAAGKIVFVPFASGEISASLIDSGHQLWTQVISGNRLGSARGFVGAISGEPVISGDRVYVGTQAGRLAAIERRTGKRIWTIGEGAIAPVWLAGDSLFVVTDQRKLKRLDIKDGSEIWSYSLPWYKNPKKQKGAYAHFGPILAGGRLLVAGGDGILRSFDPATGRILAKIVIPDGAASQPAISGGILYILSNKGQLHAFQ